MSNPLLIGQAPGPNTDPSTPLYPLPLHMTGGRLQKIMGISRSEYLTRFDRINLLTYFPGDGDGGDLFPTTPAKMAVAVLLPLLAGCTVILVGRGVVDAFGFDGGWPRWKKWPALYRRDDMRKGCGVMAAVPHPSGRNRWYNDPAHRQTARDFWDRLNESA